MTAALYRWKPFAGAFALLAAFSLAVVARPAHAADTDLYVGMGAASGHPFGGVDIFTPSGVHVSTFVADGSGGINDAWNPGFGPDGNLYLTGYFNSTIKVYDGTTGAYLRDVGSGLSHPLDVAFDNAGLLYVSNFGNNTISQIDPVSGVVLRTYTGFNVPDGILFSKSGAILVANAGGNNISSLDTTTGVSTVFATGLGNPVDLDYGPDGRIYITDGASETIKVVSGAGGTATAWSSGTGTSSSPSLVYDDGAFYATVDDGVNYYDAATGDFLGFFSTGDHNTTGIAIRPQAPGPVGAVPEPGTRTLMVCVGLLGFGLAFHQLRRPDKHRSLGRYPARQGSAVTH
jgi:WD40 repeat protein